MFQPVAMEVHITSEFQNNMSTEHDLPKIEIPSSIEINTQLDSSVILEPTYSNILSKYTWLD